MLAPVLTLSMVAAAALLCRIAAGSLERSAHTLARLEPELRRTRAAELREAASAVATALDRR